ncbi:MAG TPA: alpha/beta fold hydrolase [Planctomycetaceae bacterium]|nr:alpha/beta fold hydrolase [Planctomycetaceae bacterium]
MVAKTTLKPRVCGVAIARSISLIAPWLLVVGPACAGSKAESAAHAEYVRKMIPTKIAGMYQSGKLHELRVRGRMAYLVEPTGKVDPHKRWVWTFPFWLAIEDGHGRLQHRFYVEKLLAAGFHVAGIDVGTSCGSPSAAEVCHEFYQQLVDRHGLNRRARLIGQSNGGLIAYAWAFRHPECVDRIAGICPATDFRTWPLLPNVVAFPQRGLDYGLTLEQLSKRALEFNPIDNLRPLAAADVKILHVHGDQDELVPLPANSLELATRYKKFGGSAQIVVLKGLGHGGTPLYESEPLLTFLLAE